MAGRNELRPYTEDNVIATMVLLSAQMGLCAPPRGANLLGNPSFEQVTDGQASEWGFAGHGYRVVEGGGRDGGACIACEPEAGDATWGAMQEITFDPPIEHPFKVSGWSKAENARGADYCLYMDCWYDDGTNLWGQRRNFEDGTHGWQQIEYVFDVAKPVTKIQYFILFRRCTGKAWFDEVSLSLAPFEVEQERITPSLYGGNSIDYSARLSLPAQWTASVLRGDEGVHSESGEGVGIILSWPGTDEAGALLPGGNYIVRIDATDQLLAEELRHETPLRTRSGPGRGYIAWTESSMRRVLIDELPPKEEPPLGARIALAGNEYESFQVAIRAAPGSDLEGCTVELSDLKSNRGAIDKANIEWHQVGFVHLGELFKHPKMTHATPGWWPDPLLPVEEFDVPGGTTQSIWFTVYAPPGTPPGEYRGEFTINLGRNGAGAGAPTYEGQRIEVPVRATVYGFDIPTQPHIKTAFALMDGYLEKLYGKPLTPELRRAYGDYVLRHRLNPDDISRTDPPDIEDIAHYDARGLNAFNVLNMVEPRGERAWVCWSPLEVYTPDFKAGLIERLDPYVAELKRRGLADKAYVYTFDERGQDFWPIVKEYFGLIKERYGIPTLTTAKVPQDPEVMRELNVDWNCPVSSVYRFEEAERCREAGLQVWTYICLGPRYPYANWLADDPLVEARVIWWQAYHQKVDGFLYWGLNIWGRANNDYLIDPEEDGSRLRWGITTGGTYSWLHGDGELLYAGKEGPIGCIRLANIRDGIEDYEYLWKLAELEGSLERAREACLPITQSLTEFTRDPGVINENRERIARRIEKLGR
jgi:hypothetical protein